MSGETAAVFVVVAICSYLAVKAWINAQRAEREAHYRNESIKKIADMQGNISDAVIQNLMAAIKPMPQPPSSLNYNYNREREAFYRSETVKKIAETGGAAAALDYLRQEELKSKLLDRDGIKLGGLITAAAGIGLTAFLFGIETEEPVYLIGLVPILVGIVMVGFALSIKPRD